MFLSFKFASTFYILLLCEEFWNENKELGWLLELTLTKVGLCLLYEVPLGYEVLWDVGIDRLDIGGIRWDDVG